MKTVCEQQEIKENDFIILSVSNYTSQTNSFLGIDGATQLGVEPLLTASDIAEEDQEHIGIMAYAAKFLYLKPENSTIQSTSATNGVSKN